MFRKKFGYDTLIFRIWQQTNCIIGIQLLSLSEKAKSECQTTYALFMAKVLRRKDVGKS